MATILVVDDELGIRGLLSGILGDEGLLKEWSANGQLTMPVVMMSGHGTIDTAVEATKHGAMAFLEKPITLQKLLRSVDQALQRNQPRPAPAPVMAPGWPRSDVLLPAGAGNVALGGNGGAPAAHAQHYLTPAYSGPSAEQLFDRAAIDAHQRRIADEVFQSG